MTKPKLDENEAKNKPTHKLRLGRVAVSIWENIKEDRDPTYRATLSASYKDEHGEWKETTSLRADDLVLGEKLLGLAADWLLSKQS